MTQVINISNDPRTGYTRQIDVEQLIHWIPQQKYHMAYVKRSFDWWTQRPVKGWVYTFPDYSTVADLITELGEEGALIQLVWDIDTANWFD